MESLESDIPGDGKTTSLFYSVTLTANLFYSVYFPVLPGISPSPPLPHAHPHPCRWRVCKEDDFATSRKRGWYRGEEEGGEEGRGREDTEGWKYRRSKVPRSSIVRRYHPFHICSWLPSSLMHKSGGGGGGCGAEIRILKCNAIFNTQKNSKHTQASCC